MGIKISALPLELLFIATYADGSQIFQTPDDKSSIEPENRSQFFDVLEQAKTKQLISFVLTGKGHTYGVDLRDGHFEVDGVPFVMHENIEIIEGFELIYFRQNQVDIQQTQFEDKEVGHRMTYNIGWKDTAERKYNYKRILKID